MTKLPAVRAPEPDGPVRLRWFHRRWLPFVVVAAGFAMSLLLWRALWLEERVHLERALAAETRLINEELVARMEPRVLALVRMAERWSRRLDSVAAPESPGPGQTGASVLRSSLRQDWEMEAALNFSHFPGYEALFLVGPDGQFQWRVPPIQQASTTSIQQEVAALGASRAQRTSRLTGPLRLDSGSQGFRAYVPLFQGGTFHGWIGGGFQYQALFDAILRDLGIGYLVEISHEGTTAYRQPDMEEADSSGATFEEIEALSRIELYGSPFVISVRPGPGVISTVTSPLPQVILAGGILLSLLFGLALHYAQKADRRSRILALERRRLKRSESDLAHSRDYYLTLLERFPALIWRTDSNAWCDYHNQTWLEFTGRTFEEEQGSGWTESVHPHDLPEVSENFMAAFEAREPFEMEYRLRHYSGEYRRFSDHARPIYDLEGNFAGYLGACFDLSQREDALAALRESEEIFRTIYETAPVGISRIDHEGRFMLANDVYLRMLGYSEEELKPLSVEQVTHPEDWPRNRELHERLMRKEIPAFELQKRYLRKDGSQVWVLNTYSAVFDAAGQLLFIHVITQDITEDRRNREQLERRELQLRDAQNIARMGSWEWDLQADRVEWSDSMHDLLGIHPEASEMTFPTFLALVHPDDRSIVEEGVRCTREHDEADTIFRIQRPDGSLRWLQARQRLVRDETGEPVRMIGTDHDITEIKEAEEAIQILAAAGEAFGRSLDYRQTLREVAKVAVPALADFCFFDMRSEDDRIERFGLTHRDSDKQGLLEEVMQFIPPPDLDSHPVVRALLSGEPELVPETDDAWRDRIALSPDHARLIQALDVRSLLAVPVHGQTAVLGVLTFMQTGASGRRFSRRELPLFEELARRAGVALDNARLHEELSLREAQLAEAQAIAHVGRWDRDLLTDSSNWTDEMYRIFDLEPQSEISTADLIERFHPGDLERIKEVMLRTRETGEPFELEARVLRPDGTVRTIHALGHSEKDADGRVIHQFGTCQDVTELRRAQEALVASEEKYRILAENSADLIIRQAPDGEIRYASPAAESMLGYSPAEMLGRNGADFIHPDDLASMDRNRRALLKGKRIPAVSFRLRRRNGTWIWAEASARMIPEDSDRASSVMSVIRDISGAVLAAQRSRLLQAITAIANESTSSGPALKRILDLICDHTGWPIGHIRITDRRSGGRDTGTTDVWRVPEGTHVGRLQKQLAKTAALGESLAGQVLDQGHTIWIEDLPGGEAGIRSAFGFLVGTSEEPVAALEFFSPDPEKRNEPLIEVLGDIGIQIGEMLRRLRAETSLAASEQRFRTLSETAHDVILIADATGRILFCNASVERMFGHASDELMGRPLTILIADSSGAQPQSFERLLNARDPALMRKVLDMTGIRKDGTEVPIEMVLSWWEAEDTSYYAAILRDVTQRKQAEKSLQDRMADLAQSNAELALFTYVASHDLKEPLRTVASNVQLLERRLGAGVDPAMRKEIDFAIGGVKRMQTLIDDLLAYSRVGTDGKPFEPVESEKALEKAIDSLEVAVAESGGEISHSELPKVRGDESQIVQLFQNLLSNALKFRDIDPPRIQVSAEREGNQWVFSVRDNGIGIPADYADHVFTVFQRLHSVEQYPGTGIGLAVCRKIVDRHGGRIWVESELGEGSVFRFTIPDGLSQSREPARL